VSLNTLYSLFFGINKIIAGKIACFGVDTSRFGHIDLRAMLDLVSFENLAPESNMNFEAESWI
jgi:hypothetical protein